MRWTSLSPSWRRNMDCGWPGPASLAGAGRGLRPSTVSVALWAARGQRPRDGSAQHPVGAQPRRRPVLQLHAKREATLGQHFLDLGERLLAQVRGLEQLDLGLLDQVADVIDALGLEAV